MNTYLFKVVVAGALVVVAVAVAYYFFFIKSAELQLLEKKYTEEQKNECLDEAERLWGSQLSNMLDTSSDISEDDRAKVLKFILDSWERARLECAK